MISCSTNSQFTIPNSVRYYSWDTLMKQVYKYLRNNPNFTIDAAFIKFESLDTKHFA